MHTTTLEDRPSTIPAPPPAARERARIQAYIEASDRLRLAMLALDNARLALELGAP